MNRRRFLAVAAAGASALAGCNAIASPEREGTETPLPHRISGSACPGDPTGNPNGDRTGDPTGEPAGESTTPDTPAPDADVLRRVRVTSVTEVPDIVPVVPSIDVVRSAVTRDRTARVRITFRNVADGTVWHQATSPVTRQWISLADGAKIVLLPADGDYEPVEPGCWRSALDEREVHVGDDHVRPHPYEACERASVAFDLFGHPANTGGCLPTGEYQFFDTLYVNDREDANDTEWQYQWRFSLAVEGAE